jgi:hypothetical protein
MDSGCDTAHPQEVQPDHPEPEPLDVWFDDGTLRVVVGEKRFRVYAGILTAASSVFRDPQDLTARI